MCLLMFVSVQQIQMFTVKNQTPIKNGLVSNADMLVHLK